MKTRTFIDQTTAEVKAGKGGNGSASFRRESHVPEGGPDGGDGGHGGNVIVQADVNADSLLRIFFEPRLWAEDGVNGSGQQMHGRRGADLIVPVPCGTEVYNADTGAFLGEVLTEGQQLTIAEGGRGGWGNVHFKTSVNQAPEKAIPGQEGEAFHARFEMKLIADAGLVGFPNAGKSSLLAALSQARPKIASYPFTTLHPSIGIVTYPDFSTLKVADVPGIVEGASDGIGLGLTFLKHLARSRMLIYIIDMAGTDHREPWEDYRILKQEVETYSAELAARPTLVIANKMDEPAAEENYPKFVEETGVTPLALSIVDETHAGLATVRQALYEALKPVPPGKFGYGEHNKTEASTEPSEPIDHTMVSEERLKKATFLHIETRTKKKVKRVSRDT